jgi:heterotetrameric sarcosine oxidase gamma subunit
MHSRILDPCGIVRVQSWEVGASAPSAVEQVVGVGWPREVGVAASGLVDVLCIGPTEWLVIDGYSDGGRLSAGIQAALTGSSLRATDVSQSFVRVGFDGADVCEFLLGGCSLDLHADRFRAGRCVRTRFAGVPIVLRCLDSLRFEGIVAASYQQYVVAWIGNAS